MCAATLTLRSLVASLLSCVLTDHDHGNGLRYAEMVSQSNGLYFLFLFSFSRLATINKRTGNAWASLRRREKKEKEETVGTVQWLRHSFFSFSELMGDVLDRPLPENGNKELDSWPAAPGSRHSVSGATTCGMRANGTYKVTKIDWRFRWRLITMPRNATQVFVGVSPWLLMLDRPKDKGKRNKRINGPVMSSHWLTP
jgi:hypothetical protein